MLQIYKWVWLNTLSSTKNLPYIEFYFEVRTLHSIVDEMSEDTIVSITYSYNGPLMSGVAMYVVQSLTFNGVQRCQPIFGIFAES